jgi:CRP-like cAMP-binding protein
MLRGDKVTIERRNAAGLNPLIRKLENFTVLSDEDRHALEHAAHQVRCYGFREDIIREGDRPEAVKLLIEGWACRYKHLKDGRRQIMAYLMPGDLCDVRAFLLCEMDHSIMTLSPATVATLPRETLLGLMERHPRIAQALWWSTLVDEATLREWIVNVGQRTAYERTAHLLCEVFLRLRAVGFAQGNTCELPVTQAELADTLGLTTVHVNRTLQDLRRDGLIELRGKRLGIRDLRGLEQVALFTPNYLHLEHEGVGLDANSRQQSDPDRVVHPLT